MAQNLLEGVKVVRGPDWKWSDQDGGEGHIGVVHIDETDANKQLLRPRMVSVKWESGFKAQYRAGPKGSYDLRVVDNSATGAKHPGISCGGGDCEVKEILGTRWQCSTCEINLCTGCYLNEVTHNPEHNQFRRFDNSETTVIPIVTRNGKGPQSRIKLIGMIGSYNPEALSILDKPVITSSFPFRSSTNPFCVGDRVQILQRSQLDGATAQVLDPSEDFGKAMGATGIVQSVGDTEILVDFAEKNIKLRFRPSALIKLNRFSINQVVKIKGDLQTIEEIEKEFEINRQNLKNLKNLKLQGAIGRVVGFNPENPEEVYLQFDDLMIYDLLGRYSSISSAYLEAHETTQPTIDEELADLDYKAMELFSKAVYAGDLRSAKILYHRYGVNLAGRNADGQTALHVAIQQGHQDIAQWLLDTAGINLDQSDNLNRREIHHAVNRCNPQILKMVLDFDIDMNSVTTSGETALDIAVNNEFVECARMLVDDPAKCNVNIQDLDGNTPLHRAAKRGSSKMIEILISSARIDWNVRNKRRFNIFHLAIYSKSLKIIESFLEKGQQQFLFEWLSDTGHTVAYYACKCVNTEAMKLLILGAGQHIGKLLETRTVMSHMTPLLFSCSKMTYSIIEVLVDAGANLKAVDENGNTAAILAASSSVKTSVLQKTDSPGIFKIYEELDKEKLPILALLVYLIRNGCDWETANKAGKKAADILREKGCSKELIDMLDQTAFKCKRLPVGPNGCMMGENGVCNSEAIWRLSCPHKTPVDVCGGCVGKAYNLPKCGCPNEGMLPIPKADDSKQETAQKGDDLMWVDDGTKLGHIKDGEGNKFVNGNLRARKGKDGGYVYRCEFKTASGNECPATARRFFSETEKKFAILLDVQHKHTDLEKNSKSAAGKRAKTTSAGGDLASESSGSKQKRTSF